MTDEKIAPDVSVRVWHIESMCTATLRERWTIESDVPLTEADARAAFEDSRNAEARGVRLMFHDEQSSDEDQREIVMCVPAADEDDEA